MKKSTIRSLILYLIIIGLIINSNIIIDNSEVTLKNMYESTEIYNLNKTINTLQSSHTDFANHIQESKIKIASAITDMGVETSNQESLETMASNIKRISTNKDASSVSYDNTTSKLKSTNVQEAIDELSESSEWKFIGEFSGYNSYSDNFTKYQELFLVCYLLNAGAFFQQIPTVILGDTTSTYNVTSFYGTYGSSGFSINISKTSLSIHGAMTNNADAKSGSSIKIYAK